MLMYSSLFRDRGGNTRLKLVTFKNLMEILESLVGSQLDEFLCFEFAVNDYCILIKS
jgi:hypothetical protein